MQIKGKEEEFRPVKIELTFESEKEIAYLYCLFNHSAICDALNGVIPTGRLRAVLDDAVGGVKYEEYFADISNEIAFHSCMRKAV